ncbi:hypothetical protein DFP73DRAFT_528062 [Morchella snyderi]|nr:hypothetical protein DFP73DRAFT_528062 [Morchella snyderi]
MSTSGLRCGAVTEPQNTRRSLHPSSPSWQVWQLVAVFLRAVVHGLIVFWRSRLIGRINGELSAMCGGVGGRAGLDGGARETHPVVGWFSLCMSGVRFPLTAISPSFSPTLSTTNPFFPIRPILSPHLAAHLTSSPMRQNSKHKLHSDADATHPCPRHTTSPPFLTSHDATLPPTHYRSQLYTPCHAAEDAAYAPATISIAGWCGEREGEAVGGGAGKDPRSRWGIESGLGGDGKEGEV